MNLNILKYASNQIRTKTFNKKIVNLTENEKDNLNKIANFAISWWLKDIKENHNNNIKDNNIDFFYSIIRSTPISEENIEKLELFKYNFGIEIIKKLLEDETLELNCGYDPNGILAHIIKENDCDFLDIFLPHKSSMTITKEEIYIKEGYKGKKCLAFDIYNGYELGCNIESNYDDNNNNKNTEAILKKIDEVIEKINNGELILPTDFVPSNIDFINTYISNLKNSKKIKRYIKVS